ncbi:MAG: SGNH/GDSL hydrolase family protein [bacterium]
MRVLLLGDSIRMGCAAGPGYQAFVREAVADLADVVGPEDNCEDSGNVLAHLDRWLGAGAWRVIHFNCGLHDIKCERGTRVCKTPGDRYRDNLRGVCDRLRKTGAGLIWATTTPVIYERHLAKGFDRREEDVLAYNQVALEVIRAHGIQVNDLHAAAMAGGVERLLSGDGVHFAEAGSRLLASSVSGAIRTCMGAVRRMRTSNPIPNLVPNPTQCGCGWE